MNLGSSQKRVHEFTMQFIQCKVSLNKCLKFKMPKVPKIVVRAFSTIDSILSEQWQTFELTISFVPERFLVHISNGLFVSHLNVYSNRGIQIHYFSGRNQFHCTHDNYEQQIEKSSIYYLNFARVGDFHIIS